MSNIAVKKYYARLVRRGVYTMDQVPEEDREEVTKLALELPEHEPDPEIETPATE